MTTRIVELRRGILKKNDELAAELRARYVAAGVLVLNLVSSPGTGKTAFLERTMRGLKAGGARVAALVGDLETDNDARRLASSGAPVRQINTHGICHLDAEMIGKHLEGWEGVALDRLDYLFIENVGNLVCPSSYDLGERIRVALLSVTEGEDKPLKYPTTSPSPAPSTVRRRSKTSTRFALEFASSRPPPRPARGWRSGCPTWPRRAPRKADAAAIDSFPA